MKKLQSILTAVVLIVLQTVPAEAQSIEFEFGGTVTSVNPGFGGCDPPWDQVSVGDPWSIVYTFESTTPDADGASDHGDYAAITSYVLNIGGNIVDDSGLAGERISVFSDKPVGWDQYEVWISLQSGYLWFMQLDDDTSTAWNTDALPLCGDIELSNFSLKDFSLQGQGPGFPGCEISGSVDYHRCKDLMAPGVKWVQPPDETPTGMDIRIDSDDSTRRIVADDFKCISAGPITDIRFWGSWKRDIKGNISKIHLSIHLDIPATADTHSIPGGLLWERDFYVGEFIETLYAQLPDNEYEWWWDLYDAATPPDPNGDQQIWQYDIHIDPNVALVQEGTPSDPLVYWLDIYVETVPGVGGNFGWKTSKKHWNDDAVYYWNTSGGAPVWSELIYPPTHPYEPNSIDMAFMITTKAIVEPNEACCFTDGNCLDLPLAECVNKGGTPQGFGTECISTDCLPPDPNEACCLPDGNCVYVTAAQCHYLLGGTPQGLGTDCSSVSCPQPCTLDPVVCPATGDLSVVMTQWRGFHDNFAAIPVDPAPLPNQMLIDYITICRNSALLQFDEVPGEGGVPANSLFGHTFTGLPSGIVAARLQIRARATTGGGAGGLFNDHISIVESVAGCTATFAWSSRFKNLPEAGGDWLPGEVETFCLDLDVLPTNGGPVSVLNQLATGSLSILIDDDTGVDWVTLTIAVCPCEYRYPAEVIAGENDNCEFAAPFEQASPSTEMVTALGGTWRNFNQIIPNMKFGHTFTGLPSGIVAAELEICMRAGTGLSWNDHLHLEFLNPTFRWGNSIASLTQMAWNAGDINLLTLDIDNLPPSNTNVTSVLGDLADGDLDVYIQDDTAVDYIILRYWKCCEKAVPGNINLDEIVDFEDVAILANHWLEIDPLGCHGCP